MSLKVVNIRNDQTYKLWSYCRDQWVRYDLGLTGEITRAVELGCLSYDKFVVQIEGFGYINQ